RSHAPRSMRDGKELVGWGMASGIWETLLAEISARATLMADGSLEIASAASDIGTGTYTIMAQVAGETLGLPADRIRVKLGDSDLPESPLEGGSWMAASVGAAVQLACRSLADKSHQVVTNMNNPTLGTPTLDQVEFADGAIRLKG